ncbi:hypothetical protein, partial [Shewanella waksmanii]|uniref:hypothetical protein n=1 Tax=Shewanella waksmanii TaxID=213783 RepID=UPI0037350E39
MSKYVTFYKSSIDVKPSNGGDEGTCYFKKYLDKKLIKQQEIKKCSASKETSANDQSRKGQNYQGTKEESEGVGLLDIHSAILAAQAALRSYEAKTGENLAQNIQVSRGQSSSSAILINDHRALSISVLGSSSESVSEVSRSSELNSLNECKVSKDSVGSFSGLSMSHQVFALPGKDNGLPRSEIKQQVTVKADSAGANTAFVALDKD